eukprot:g7839.t1
MLLSLVLLVAFGFGTAAPQHARGSPALEDDRREDDGFSRLLGSHTEYKTKNETEYASCPEGYPAFGRLGDLLTAWSPNQPDVPEGVVIERLQVLNFTDPAHLATAEKLRDCEVPFKVVGVPEADAASSKWTDEYLEEKMNSCHSCNVMRSDSNRFMFWHKKGALSNPTWKPPTSPEKMSFGAWREWTREADANKIGPEDVHYYLTTGVGARSKTPPATGEFVADDLPIFSTMTENFFITDVSHQKGIQCRFGARGIIAESHFDHGKNFVLMLRGRKRYLLNPPRACPYLDIISDKKHPSFRHSVVDWSDKADWPEGFADAPALETVLEAGELLYIPSFWYHYIVSEGFNVQCNARSGLSLRKTWMDETQECMGRDLPLSQPPRASPPSSLREMERKGAKGLERYRARKKMGGRERVVGLGRGSSANTGGKRGEGNGQRAPDGGWNTGEEP